MRELAITGLGPDRPGIVAGVTEILYREGLSLVDTSMTILEGQFAFILIARGPEGVDAASLQGALKAVAEGLGVHLFVSEMAPRAEAETAPAAAPGRGEPWMISVAGHDRTGITYRVCAALARHGVNVTDLESRVIPGDGGPVYIMMIEVVVPGRVDRAALDAELKALARELDVEISHRPIDAPAL